MRVLNASPRMLGSSCGLSASRVSRSPLNPHPSYLRHTVLRALSNELLNLCLLLQLLAIASFEPALGGFVVILVLVSGKRGQKLSDSGWYRRLSLLRGVVDWRDPAQWRARCEEREEVRGQLVRHG